MRKVHQIWITDKSEPLSDYISKKNSDLRKMYYDHEFVLYDHKSLIRLIKDNFDKEVLFAYAKCNPYAFKADLARYCILYLYGGYYFDISICPNFRYEHTDESFILEGESVEIDGTIHKVLDNGIMYFQNPFNNFLKSAIEKSVENILNSNYGKHPLDITGPMMLYRLDHSNIKKYPCSIINDKKVICIDEKAWFEYHNGFSALPTIKNENSNITLFGTKGTNSYSQMWFEKNVFDESIKVYKGFNMG